MKVAYLDCFSGVAGDMFLGALLDAGLDDGALREVLAGLPLGGYALRAERGMRGAISGTQVIIEVREPQPARHLADILGLLDRSSLPHRVRERAAAAFRRLAAAEGEVHGMPPDKVHFHEVGAVDSIVDIVGVFAAVDLHGIERFATSPLRMGRGTVRGAHGLLPVPAPATATLARGLPVELTDIEAELTTPTGALLVSSLVGDLPGSPAMRLASVGVGLGAREIPGRPNIFRILIGDADGTVEGEWRRGEVAVLETTVDDMTPELLAHLPQRLIAAGALDCTLEPVLLKKGRPGHRIVVLARLEGAEALAGVLLRESTTLGVRLRREERIEISRGIVEVATPSGAIRVKVARRPDGTLRAHPEYEDCLRVAEAAGRPLLDVTAEALEAWSLAGRPEGVET
jgi:uncharacterized protein (TIGR00299 family) protein